MSRPPGASRGRTVARPARTRRKSKAGPSSQTEGGTSQGARPPARVRANGGDTVPTSAAARTDSPTEPGTRRRADMLAYNLFRHRGEHDLFCAVPEDFAVPAFLSDGAWEFTGKVDEPDSAPADFDLKTAGASTAAISSSRSPAAEAQARASRRAAVDVFPVDRRQLPLLGEAAFRPVRRFEMILDRTPRRRGDAGVAAHGACDLRADIGPDHDQPLFRVLVDLVGGVAADGDKRHGDRRPGRIDVAGRAAREPDCDRERRPDPAKPPHAHTFDLPRPFVRDR